MELIKGRLRTREKERGFSLLEVIVAAAVLTIGLLTVAMMFTTSLGMIKASEEDSIARQEAQQMIEGIFAARNTGGHPFSDFQSAAAPVSVPPVPGIFSDGYQPAKQAGPDGIMNTADDGPGYETGPDGRPLTNFERQVVFRAVLLPNLQVDPNTRQIEVSVRYRIGNLVRTYTQTTYISTYR